MNPDPKSAFTRPFKANTYGHTKTMQTLNWKRLNILAEAFYASKGQTLLGE